MDQNDKLKKIGEGLRNSQCWGDYVQQQWNVANSSLSAPSGEVLISPDSVSILPDIPDYVVPASPESALLNPDGIIISDPSDNMTIVPSSPESMLIDSDGGISASLDSLSNLSNGVAFVTPNSTDKLIQDVSQQQAQEIVAMNIDGITMEDSALIVDTLETQMRTFICIAQSVQTPDIVTLDSNFRAANWVAGMDGFISEVSDGYTPAPNIALLQNAGYRLESFVTGGYPTEVRQMLEKMQKRTGERLSQNNKLEISVSEQMIRPIYSTETTVGMEFVNMAASSTEVFTDLTEEEIIVFMKVLRDENEFAGQSPVGKKILWIIRDWKSLINFDRECYFHSRAKREDGIPYTSTEMGKAPDDVVKGGRYNHPKQSHYYFADTKEGAEEEVKFHHRNALVQTAKLLPIKDIQMVDFSEEISKQNFFLQSLRYKISPDDFAPKEYLFPQYVATCCKKANIEGIKYYGSETYKNYVTWSGDYFKINVIS